MTWFPRRLFIETGRISSGAGGPLKTARSMSERRQPREQAKTSNVEGQLEKKAAQRAAGRSLAERGGRIFRAARLRPELNLWREQQLLFARKPSRSWTWLRNLTPAKSGGQIKKPTMARRRRRPTSSHQFQSAVFSCFRRPEEEVAMKQQPRRGELRRGEARDGVQPD